MVFLDDYHLGYLQLLAGYKDGKMEDETPVRERNFYFCGWANYGLSYAARATYATDATDAANIARRTVRLSYDFPCALSLSLSPSDDALRLSRARTKRTQINKLYKDENAQLWLRVFRYT